MHSHGAAHGSRPMPDHDSRRRNRQRVNSIRSSNGGGGGGGGGGGATARFSNPPVHRSGGREHNSGSGSNPNLSPNPSSSTNASTNSNSRPPVITNRNIFDAANTVAAVLGQPRSVTPHPNVLENGGATPASSSHMGGRRSSLPAGDEPVRDAARDAARAEMLGIQPLVQPTTPQGEGDAQMTAISSPATELFAASARVQSAAWAGRPVSETFVGGGGFQAGVMDGGSARRWGGRG